QAAHRPTTVLRCRESFLTKDQRQKRLPTPSGFLARHNSELPKGFDPTFSHQLSIFKTPVSSVLIGAAGTEISCCACSSARSPRPRWMVRASSIGRKSDALVYVIRTT